MATFDDLARDITKAAIESGHVADGAPGEAVSSLYVEVARALRGIDVEEGSDAMTAAGELAVSAVRAGLVWGHDTIDFMRHVARQVRTINRELGAATGPGRAY